MRSACVVARNIADGVTGELYAGRVTAANGIITQVEKGDFVPEQGEIFLDENKLLAPGFLDAHGHSDISVMAMPAAEGKVFQGITGEICGNCGLSAFPLTARNRDHLQELYKQYGITLDWHDLAGYRRKLQEKAPALELFPQVGHNTLRAAVAGYEQKELSAAELSEMCSLLDRELAGGALGLSFGLLYTPGCFAGFEEITALMQVVAQHGKVCSVHLKSEGNALENALELMLDAARSSGLERLHLSHLKTAGKSNFHKIKNILEALQTPDIYVTGDVYCYDASMSQLSLILPAPFDEYDDVKITQLLRDEKCFEQLLLQVQAERSGDYWQNVRIISASDAYSVYNQMFIDKAARLAKVAPAQLFLEILRSNASQARAAYHTLSRENMQLLAAHASVVPGSDESARDRTLQFGSSHPRGFGNHAEYFNLRLSQGAPLARVVSEMSSCIAGFFNIPRRGAISCGNKAVFTVVEPDLYRATATFEKPHQLCPGAEILRLQD